jgi:hypothetical protein
MVLVAVGRSDRQTERRSITMQDKAIGADLRDRIVAGLEADAAAVWKAGMDSGILDWEVVYDVLVGYADCLERGSDAGMVWSSPDFQSVDPIRDARSVLIGRRFARYRLYRWFAVNVRFPLYRWNLARRQNRYGTVGGIPPRS